MRDVFACGVCAVVLGLLGCHRRTASLGNAATADAAGLEASVATASVDGGADGCIVLDAATNSGSHAELDGVVDRGKHHHPNGSSFTFYVVRLRSPRCVTGSEDASTVTEIQLAPKGDDVELDRFVGKKVHVAGDTFGQLTAWHVRPVLISVDTIALTK